MKYSSIAEYVQEASTIDTEEGKNKFWDKEVNKLQDEFIAVSTDIRMRGVSINVNTPRQILAMLDACKYYRDKQQSAAPPLSETSGITINTGDESISGEQTWPPVKKDLGEKVFLGEGLQLKILFDALIQSVRVINTSWEIFLAHFFHGASPVERIVWNDEQQNLLYFFYKLNKNRNDVKLIGSSFFKSRSKAWIRDHFIKPDGTYFDNHKLGVTWYNMRNANGKTIMEGRDQIVKPIPEIDDIIDMVCDKI